MSANRRGGIPGPESRTGLVRPAMTEAEFERRMATLQAQAEPTTSAPDDEPASHPTPAPKTDPEPAPRASNANANAGSGSSRTRRGRGGSSKTRRVQRMFAIEDDLDRKLWLYAIHVGKDRSEVVNDLLRPLVGSMVLYDSRERRSSRNSEADDASIA